MIPPWVMEYLDIPFVSGGRDRRGCDCYGLVRLVLAEHFGKELPPLDCYQDALHAAQTEAVVDRYQPLLAGTRVEHPAPGDVAVMRLRGHHCHVGICIAPGVVLHTDRPTGTVAERLCSARLRGRIEGYYRVD